MSIERESIEIEQEPLGHEEIAWSARARQNRWRGPLAVRTRDQRQSRVAAEIDHCRAMNLLGVLWPRSSLPTDTTARRGVPRVGEPRLLHPPITPDARSCCCPAAPVAQVVTSPAGARNLEVDILLCAHHLRRSAAALRRLGAVVYDHRGDVVDDVTVIFARVR
jgi:hypothetical protein